MSYHKDKHYSTCGNFTVDLSPLLEVNTDGFRIMAATCGYGGEKESRFPFLYFYFLSCTLLKMASGFSAFYFSHVFPSVFIFFKNCI